MVFLFLALIVLCLLCQAFFTMMEMAIVSLDRTRLEYRVQKGDVKAKIIKSLLEKPSLLFTTTLIGVNSFLQIGSQCSRYFFESLSLNPNYSAIGLVFVALLFAELLPLMIARQFSFTIAFKGAKVLNCVRIFLTPIVWLMQKISSFIERIFGKNKSSLFSLSRNELESLISQKEKNSSFDLVTLMNNLKQLKLRSIHEIMIPLKKLALFEYKSSLDVIKMSLKKQYQPFALIYLKQKSSIMGLIYTRDLLDRKIESIDQVMHPAWFVTDSGAVKMLKLFRENKRKMALVLNNKGETRGAITLELLLAEILANTHQEPLILNEVIDKHVCLDSKISTLNEKYNLLLPENKGDKIAHLFNIIQQNPIHFGHIRLTKKDRRVHIETMHL